jgi:hypothetical protein
LCPLSNIFYLKACHASTHLISPVCIHSSLSIILQLGSLISCHHLISIWLPTYHFCFGSPFCFILSTLHLVCTPAYSSVSLSVTHQARYQFSDSPNFSGVDFVPHATSFSVQMDSPFLLKLTSRLHFFIFFSGMFPLQATPRYQTLVVLDLQFYSFALLCFVGKLWWIGPLCSFSSLGTVSIVRCPACHYWVFRFIPFPSTRLRVLITLLVLAGSIIRSTVGSPTYQ